MKSRLLASVVLLAATLAACGGGGGDDSANLVSFDATAVSANLADNVITATYVALDTAAQDLASKVSALESGGASDAELDAAQAAWKATRAPWESSESFLFGPVDAEGIDPLIDTWPLATADLAEFLAGGNTSTDDVRNASENVQGFHTLEYLLFGDGVADNDQPASELDADEIDYLGSAAAVLRERTQRLAAAWTTQYDPGNAASGPYADQLKTPGAGRAYINQAAVIEELLNSMISILDEVGNGKISEPFGSDINNTDNSLEESQFSYNSLTDFHNNIQSVLNLYTGVPGFDPRSGGALPAFDKGIFAFVFAHNAALASATYSDILAAYDAVGLIDGDGDPSTTDIVSPAQMSFREAINDAAGRVRVQDAIDKLAIAQQRLIEDVVPLIERTAFAH